MILVPIGLSTVGRVPILSLVLIFSVVGFASYWWLARALVVPVTVLEGTGLRDSMDRSRVLTESRRWRILVICVLVLVLTWAMMSLFQLPALATGGLHFIGGRLTADAWSAAILAVGAFVGASVAGPLLTIALTLAYYDARVRKEGFDLQLMMSSLAGISESEVVANV